jgi:hypothetical protein
MMLQKRQDHCEMVNLGDLNIFIFCGYTNLYPMLVINNNILFNKEGSSRYIHILVTEAASNTVADQCSKKINRKHQRKVIQCCLFNTIQLSHSRISNTIPLYGTYVLLFLYSKHAILTPTTLNRLSLLTFALA